MPFLLNIRMQSQSLELVFTPRGAEIFVIDENNFTSRAERLGR